MTRQELEKRFTAARRAAIEREFEHLNPEQRRAVMATEGPLLLLAGAGSGKTTVLINRIANLLKYGAGSDSDFVPESVTESELALLEDYIKDPANSDASNADAERVQRLCALSPAEPWRIIAITFTNKAAGEIKARLERMLGPRARDIWAMTFHSACVRILRRDIEKLGYGSGFTIYDTADSMSLIKRIIKERDLDEKTYPPRSVLGQISRSKDAMISPDDFLAAAEKTSDVRKRRVAEIFMEYQSRMKAANALDFDDLILLTVRLLREHADVREYYQQRFKYVLIDEYQDTNNLQYRLAALLTGERENICVVGDDDQSIYKFRGATIENILSFEKQYKKARVIRLEQNYRSTGHILSAANEVILNNRGRKGKTLWTENEDGARLSLYIASDEREEALFVANAVLAGVSEGGRFSDNAVLYRMNAQSNQLETAFKRLGVPYKIVGGTGFYDRMEVKDMLAYLCVIENPEDDLRLLRVINNPPRGIGAKTVERVQEIARDENVAMMDVMKRSRGYEDFGKAAARLTQFADMIEDLRELCRTEPLDAVYDALVERSGYVRALMEKKSDENLTRIENVNELKSNIISYVEDNADGSLFGFLSETALYTDLESLDQNADSVVMMTMHSAKGLEFDTVFIVGAEEGIFPGTRAIGEPEEMEEERRLCYVAMTRARKLLYFISARQRMLFGRTTAGQLSRFVDEISGENIEKPERRTSYSRDFGGYGDFGVAPATGFASRGADVPQRTTKPPPRRTVERQKPVPVQQAVLPDYKKGDAIRHRAFGAGVITDVTPAGGDALIEVEFEGNVKKRLMLKSAAAYMEKVTFSD